MKQPPAWPSKGVTLGPHLYDAVANDEIDLAQLGTDNFLPEGLTEQKMPTLQRFTYMDTEHPATLNWNRQASRDWLHVMVGMENAARQTVQDCVARDGLERPIGAHRPEFWDVTTLLARTKLLGTTAQLFMADDINTYELVAKRPPIDLPDINFCYF